MNITANSTTQIDSTSQTQNVSNENSSNNNTEKVSSANKTQEKKEETKTEQKNDFKKVMEEQKSTDKISIEQAQQNNQNNLQNIDEQYVNKFGFDTISGFKNIKSMYNFDTAKISKDDAKFFVDLVENKQYALQQNGENQNLIKFADEIGPTYKTQQTSKVLTDLLTKAYKEGQPVRLDFDNNCSVILKVDSKGKISADFIPGDKAVEAYLRNNINSLKQRFDDQNLPYNDIMYRQSNQNNRERRQNQQQNRGE